MQIKNWKYKYYLLNKYKNILKRIRNFGHMDIIFRKINILFNSKIKFTKKNKILNNIYIPIMFK